MSYLLLLRPLPHAQEAPVLLISLPEAAALPKKK